MNKCPKCGAPGDPLAPDGDFKYRPPRRGAAKAAAILAMLREPDEALADEIADKFDDAFLPALTEATRKYGGSGLRPAFAAWGPAFLRALADAIEARQREAAP